MSFARLIAPGFSGKGGKNFPNLTQKATAKLRFNSFAEEEFVWQDDATECLIEHLRCKLVSPTGSGKTEIIKAAAWHHAFAGNRRCLIVVPQQHIADGFLKICIKRKDGTKIDHKIGEELDFRGIDEGYHESVTDGLRDWLMGTDDKPSIAITTTAALTKVFYEKIPRDQWGKAFTRLWMAIDEAHHISVVQAEDEEHSAQERDHYNKIGTRLGQICEALLNESDAGLAVISATHFRGDGLPMFLDEANKQFTGCYTREFEDHWKWLGYDHFSYDCAGYDGDPSDALLNNITSEKQQRHVVCVPADGLRFRKNTKWVADFILRLEAAGFKCLDLVSDEKDANKQRLLADNKTYKETGKTEFDVIIACNLMREGTDWIPASRVHDLAPSASANRTVQTIGRMTRKDINKSNLAYIAYFRNLEQHASEESVKKHAADRVNIALSGMLLAEDLFAPVRLDLDDEGTRRTLGEWEVMVFGKERDAIRQTFMAALDDVEHEPTPEDINDCAQKALSNWQGDTLTAMRILRRIARLALKVNEPTEGEDDGAIDPDIRVTPGKLDVAEIREAGFDIVKPWSGLRLFVSKTRRQELGKLGKIVRPMRDKQSDLMARAQRRRVSDVRDKQAEAHIRKTKRKAVKTPAERAIAPTGGEKRRLGGKR
jgi:superfamily II DNA or RNA helicase